LSPYERPFGCSDSAFVAGEGGCYFSGDIVLHIEQVCCGAIIPVRPNVAACSCIDELGGYPYLIASRLNAAFEYVADTESAANSPNVRWPASINFRRISGDDK